jgi:hypothetical protein
MSRERDSHVYESIILKFVMGHWVLEVDTRLNVLSIAEPHGTVMTGASSSGLAMGLMWSSIRWTQGTVC